MTDRSALVEQARHVATTTLAMHAATVDNGRTYPSEGLAALGAAGLMGLLIPAEQGGLGGGLGDLAAVGEELGAVCASTAMCFLMHSCGAALLAAKATGAQIDAWLRPAGRGAALATLAFSERGSGAHFYAPEITATATDGGFLLTGRKHFVTSGGHATLYPVLVNATGAQGLDILVVTRDLPGVSFEGAWDGIGMAGNSSIAMVLDNVEVPAANLAGAEGDGQALVFGVVAPTFLAGLAAVNVGIGRAALEAASAHAKGRNFPAGQALAEVAAIQRSLGEMSTTLEAARQLVRAPSAAADGAEPAARWVLTTAVISSCRWSCKQKSRPLKPRWLSPARRCKSAAGAHIAANSPLSATGVTPALAL